MVVYKPIASPGGGEAGMLNEHPEWAESHPWRLLNVRDEDQRQAKRSLPPPTPEETPEGTSGVVPIGDPPQSGGLEPML